VTVANTVTGKTLGQTAIGPDGDTGAANHMQAWRFVMPNEAGQATALSIYIASPVSAAPNNQFQVAVFADAAGVPGALLVSSASQAAMGNAWNTVPIAVALQPNTAYWLAYNTNGSTASANNMRLAPGAAGQMRWATRNFGTWPAKFGKTSGSAPQQASIFLSYTPQ